MNKLFFCLLLSFSVFAHAETIKAKSSYSDKDVNEILQKIDKLWRGESSKGVMKMLVKTEHYERSMTMSFLSEGQGLFIVRITEPKKDRGTATLKRDKEIYNYLPKIDRTIKVDSAMMSGSWMGSHITNDDMVQSSLLSRDYVPSITSQKKEGVNEILEITLTPKPNSPVVWGKMITTVKMPEAMPLKHVYFDEDMKQARTMEFSEEKKMGGRLMPTVFTVKPADKPLEYTKIIYENITFGVAIKADDFSITNLKKMQ